MGKSLGSVPSTEKKKKEWRYLTFLDLFLQANLLFKSFKKNCPSPQQTTSEKALGNKRTNGGPLEDYI
jgi:hypothetical protein